MEVEVSFEIATMIEVLASTLQIYCVDESKTLRGLKGLVKSQADHFKKRIDDLKSTKVSKK